jgi:hypothetical protein
VGTRPAVRQISLSAVCVLSILAAVLLAAGLDGPVPGALILIAAVLSPGCAVVSWLDIPEGPVQVALVIPVSIAVLVVCSAVPLWLGMWSPLGTTAVLLAISGLVLELRILTDLADTSSSAQSG